MYGMDLALKNCTKDEKTVKLKKMATHKIVVSTELDKLSAKITEFAVGLSAQLGTSELILLNVIIPARAQTFSTTGDISTFDTHNVNLFNIELMKKHQLLVNEEAGKHASSPVQIKPVVRFNENKKNLNSMIKSFKAGLLVIGSRDQDSFISRVFGSDSDEIVKKTDYPSIVLKEDTKAGDIHKIVVALDVNEKDQSGLEKIADFAKALHASINLLYVDMDGETSPDSAIEKMRELSLAYKLSDYAISVVSSHTLEEGIKGFVRKTHPDMIAVLSQGKGKIRKLLFGSSTDEILQEADVPVFITKIH
jgi:nucleotide-binding universal stress UspA family protein